MDDYRSVSLGNYYDLQVRFTKTSGGGTIEVGWYKKAANSSSYNSADANGYVQINGVTVYNPTRIDFDMRSNSVGDFKAFYTTSVSGKSVHVVAYFDANMSSGNVKSGTIDWTITLQEDGVVTIAVESGGRLYWHKYRPYVWITGRGWVPAKAYLFNNGWKPAK